MSNRASLDHLIKQEFIDQIPGFFGVLSLQAKFLMVNQTGANWTGFKSSDQMLDLSYSDVRCKAAEHTDLFLQQDKKVIQSNNTTKFLGFYCYENNDWKIILGQKYLLRNKNNEPIGLISQFNDYTHTNIVDLSRFLIKSNKINKKQFLCSIEDNFLNLNLSKRQAECLFFLLRGKTTKAIAELLKLSARTIESFIDIIKFKLGCNNKSELIEKAIFNGYMNSLPSSLFEGEK